MEEGSLLVHDKTTWMCQNENRLLLLRLVQREARVSSWFIEIPCYKSNVESDMKLITGVIL